MSDGAPAGSPTGCRNPAARHSKRKNGRESLRWRESTRRADQGNCGKTAVVERAAGKPLPMPLKDLGDGR
jgi:hypothetical protein